MVPPSQHPILIFDSGLGGLTVYREVRQALPHASITYLADAAGFPYGERAEAEVAARVMHVIQQAVRDNAPSAIVIACNTASTLVLPQLRSRFSMPIVGTVPAIKPAVAASVTRHIAVLATPGTAARDYTRQLIADHAGDCLVTLVASSQLAALAESAMMGENADNAAIAAEIAPCFVERESRRTDTVVLACTHYPLLLDRLEKLAPWPVQWIDPAPAIARQTARVLGEVAANEPTTCRFVTTGELPPISIFTTFGFTSWETMNS